MSMKLGWSGRYCTLGSIGFWQSPSSKKFFCFTCYLFLNIQCILNYSLIVFNVQLKNLCFNSIPFNTVHCLESSYQEKGTPINKKIKPVIKITKQTCRHILRRHLTLQSSKLIKNRMEDKWKVLPVEECKLWGPPCICIVTFKKN